MKKIIGIILILIILVGCNDAFEEYVKKGDKAFNDSNLNVALTNYEHALEEKSDNKNTEEIKNRIEFLEKVTLLFDSIAENDFEEAIVLVKSVLNNEYIIEMDKLHKDVRKLEEIVDDYVKNDRSVKASISNITELLENEQIDEAEDEFEKLNSEYIVIRFSKEVEAIEKEIEKKQKEQENTNTAKIEELPATANYESYGKTFKNRNSSDPQLNHIEIQGNQLIVSGSLNMIEEGSDELIYLEDKRRVFTLAEDVDLALDWVGNKDEQIEYFNKNTKATAAVIIKIKNNEVIGFGYAG